MTVPTLPSHTQPSAGRPGDAVRGDEGGRLPQHLLRPHAPQPSTQPVWKSSARERAIAPAAAAYRVILGW